MKSQAGVINLASWNITGDEFLPENCYYHRRNKSSEFEKLIEDRKAKIQAIIKDRVDNTDIFCVQNFSLDTSSFTDSGIVHSCGIDGTKLCTFVNTAMIRRSVAYEFNADLADRSLNLTKKTDEYYKARQKLIDNSLVDNPQVRTSGRKDKSPKPLSAQAVCIRSSTDVVVIWNVRMPGFFKSKDGGVFINHQILTIISCLTVTTVFFKQSKREDKNLTTFKMIFIGDFGGNFEDYKNFCEILRLTGLFPFLEIYQPKEFTSMKRLKFNKPPWEDEELGQAFTADQLFERKCNQDNPTEYDVSSYDEQFNYLKTSDFLLTCNINEQDMVKLTVFPSDYRTFFFSNNLECCPFSYKVMKMANGTMQNLGLRDVAELLNDKKNIEGNELIIESSDWPSEHLILSAFVAL